MSSVWFDSHPLWRHGGGAEERSAVECVALCPCAVICHRVRDKHPPVTRKYMIGGFGSSTTETVTTTNAKGQRVTRSVTETQVGWAKCAPCVLKMILFLSLNSDARRYRYANSAWGGECIIALRLLQHTPPRLTTCRYTRGRSPLLITSCNCSASTPNAWSRVRWRVQWNRRVSWNRYSSHASPITYHRMQWKPCRWAKRCWKA